VPPTTTTLPPTTTTTRPVVVLGATPSIGLGGGLSLAVIFSALGLLVSALLGLRALMRRRKFS
jgi:hypothetical protein